MHRHHRPDIGAEYFEFANQGNASIDTVLFGRAGYAHMAAFRQRPADLPPGLHHTGHPRSEITDQPGVQLHVVAHAVMDEFPVVLPGVVVGQVRDGGPAAGTLCHPVCVEAGVEAG
ncbi:hypothetical protein ACIBK8_18525 [Streptomyces sp. NPDC050161]|uniref:hypothetical protein n=1 Tax=Streptomyces sp. NPDC050161 TaxID=3365604 RepID=UPI00379C1DF3